jgi:hypothetical protein
MPKESSRRGNHPGSLTFSKRKNQAMRRTRRKQGRPEGSFRDAAIHSK